MFGFEIIIGVNMVRVVLESDSYSFGLLYNVGCQILPLFLDISCIVFCEKIHNIRCMAELWDFFT
jgi:hypothetical protein